MTDFILAVKMAEALASQVRETEITLRNVPWEFVKDYEATDKEKEPLYTDRVKFFDNGSKIFISTLPF